MTYLVIFHTYSGVLRLEKALKKMDITFEIMPAPRKLSVDCGVSIKFESDRIKGIIESINTSNIHRIFTVENGENKIIFEND